VDENIFPEKQNVSVGDSMSIECKSAVNVSWLFSGGPLPDPVKLIGHNIIGIEHVEIEHRGVYECVGKTSKMIKFIGQSHLIVASKT